MSDWDPATEAEDAMREALAAADQELYFRILARSEVLLPVSAEALAGLAPMGWGTWTTANRTHVLAFTSPAALYACLNEPGGSYRTVPFHALAEDWPNYEWWLAVNPGLPIEAYLPSWFVSQLTRGEVRLPGRTMGARARMAQSDLAAALSGRVRASTPPPTVLPAEAVRPGPPLRAGEHPSDRYGDRGDRSAQAERTTRVRDERISRDERTRDTSRDDRGRDRGRDDRHRDDSYRDDRYRDDRYQDDRYRDDRQRDDRQRDDRYQDDRYRDRPAERYGERLGERLSAAGAPRSEAPRVETPRGDAPRRREVIETIEAEIVDDPGDVGSERIYAAEATVAAPVDRFEPPYGRGPGAGVTFAARTGASSRYEPEAGPGVGSTSRFGSAGPPRYEQAYAGETVRVRPPRAEPLDAELVSPGEAWPGDPVPRRPKSTPAPPEPEEQPKEQPKEEEPASFAPGFTPANETEVNLLAAAEENDTDAFLSTLLLARVILPVPAGTHSSARPRDREFPWQFEDVDGQRFVSVFTSPERLAEHSFSRYGPGVSSVSLRFVQLIGAWPDDETSFAINPGSPVGATLPGTQIVALAAWATEVGLRDEPSADLVVPPKTTETKPSVGVAGAPTVGAGRATIMQRTVPPSQLPFYLERGYDRVSGFVNRAAEVSHLTSPRMLYRALGLLYSGSPFNENDDDVHVVRWVAHRSDLYRLPYGGQHEAAMRAMQGWVVERAPFRGNGFAPGDTDVVAEFKVDSVRLPHGAQMWRLAKDATETMVATFDADSVKWNPTPFGGWHA